MGGNAMKHVGVTRKPAAEYFDITKEVVDKLNELFPQRYIFPIAAYSKKESFGDSDILMVSDNLPENWLDQVKNAFTPQDIQTNGGVTSFDFRGMQIDLILTPSDEFDFAQTYFAFNDLGNLMGAVRASALPNAASSTISGSSVRSCSTRTSSPSARFDGGGSSSPGSTGSAPDSQR